MTSAWGGVHFLATGDSVLPAGAAQPMTLGAGDVMRLLLGTRPRILPQQPLKLGGEPEREGREGREAGRAASSLSPIPLSVLRKGPRGRDKGMGGHPPSRTSTAEQLWSRGQAGGRTQARACPAGSRGPGHSTQRVHPMHLPKPGPGQGTGQHLLHPRLSLPYLPGHWVSVCRMALSTSLGSLWEGRAGGKSCGSEHRPLSCSSEGLATWGCGTDRRWWQPMSLKSSESPSLIEGASGSPCKPLEPPPPRSRQPLPPPA